MEIILTLAPCVYVHIHIYIYTYIHIFPTVGYLDPQGYREDKDMNAGIGALVPEFSP